jgi:hypothetical protein
MNTSSAAVFPSINVSPDNKRKHSELNRSSSQVRVRFVIKVTGDQIHLELISADIKKKLQINCQRILKNNYSKKIHIILLLLTFL